MTHCNSETTIPDIRPIVKEVNNVPSFTNPQDIIFIVTATIIITIIYILALVTINFNKPFALVF
jgi:amino acid transporter